MTSPANEEHACVCCGRSPDDGVECADDGEIAPGSSTQWVYCYRGGRPFGLCDRCFHKGDTVRFTETELAWFRERFANPGKAP